MFRRSSAFVLLLALAGCGGRVSSSPASDATPAMKAAVTQTLTGLVSTCDYQVFGPLWFVEGLSFAVGGIDPAYPPDVDDPLVGTPESGPLPTTYQNGSLGLWENLPNGDYSREEFFVDQALTQPAGFSTDVTGGAGPTTTDTQHYEITAGPYAGSHGDAQSTFQDGPKGDGSDDLWHETYSYTASDGTLYAGTFDYKGLAYTSSAITTRPDGTKDTVSADIDANDKGTIVFVSHAGITLTANFTDYGTASGTLTGDAPGLPARFSAGTKASDDFTVRFKDGSVASFGGAPPALAARMRAMKAAKARHLARLRAHSAR